jgi:hypothetical protein
MISNISKTKATNTPIIICWYQNQFFLSVFFHLIFYLTRSLHDLQFSVRVWQNWVRLHALTAKLMGKMYGEKVSALSASFWLIKRVWWARIEDGGPQR